MAVRKQEHTSPQPTHPPQAIHISSASPLFSPHTWTHQEQWRGNTEASEKENTLKASMGVKGAQQRMTWVMETRVDRRSNTGGSLLRILLNRNDSPTHWLQYPVSHERTQLDPHTHTHAWLILMPPDTCTQCVSCKCVASRAKARLCSSTCSWRENLDVHDSARKLHTSGFAELLGKDHNRGAILGGKTDDYGVTRCDTRMLQASRGVKQAELKQVYY